jgi:hypothetical protein
MDSPNTIDAVRLCEDVLRKDRQYNLEHSIWPSINIVIDRMLERGLELRDVYGELNSKLGSVHYGISTFLDSILGVAALWHPDAISKQRASREQLVEINNQIGRMADELANLIKLRSDLSNESGFSADCHYHIGEVIEEAASSEALFNLWLKEPMKNLRGQFGLKYWPQLSDVIRVLATDAKRAKVEATDTITEAATSARRPSKSDFVRALYVALSDRSERNDDRLPIDFKLSDGSMASLVNCLLDLGPDEVVDGAYIKRFRQRERQADFVGEDSS